MPRYARLFCLFLLLTLRLPLGAALPELSSLDPIEYDEQAQRLVARGNAQLQIDDTRVTADRITYYRPFSLADADGQVVIDRAGLRMLAERMSYEAETGIFSIETLRTGSWPYYLNARSAGGTAEEAELNEVTLHYGAPGAFSPSIHAQSVAYRAGAAGTLHLKKATLRLGKIPLFYLPSYTHQLGRAPFDLDVTAGSDSELGTYLQTTSLLHITPWFRAGANLDFYSKRGALAGPTAQYLYHSATQSIVGAFSSGSLKDRGDANIDINGQPTPSSRGFAEWRHQQQIDERLQLTAALSYWSDSEVTRDFREDYFNQNRRPDNFAEASYSGGNYLLSAFGRFQTGDFYLTQERLPEVRLDIFPIPLLNTGAYHQASASYARLREDFLQKEDYSQATDYQRFDLNYRIQRPYRLSDWATLTPLAGTRLTHYQNQEMDTALATELGLNPRANTTRKLYEFGFDLEARAHASYPTVNKTWGINGLRHLVRPVARYRYTTGNEVNREIAAIERRAFDLDRPLINLGEQRSIDTFNPTHLLRIGIENRYQTRASGYGSRDLAALNFYQDVLLDKDDFERYDQEPASTFDASWVELMLRPAPWLKFDLSARLKTQGLTLEQLVTRTALISGESWQIGLSTDMLRRQIDQYRIDFITKLNERYALFSDIRFDSQANAFTHTRVGIHTKIGNIWEVIYALSFRNNTTRESDFGFTVSLRLNDL